VKWGHPGATAAALALAATLLAPLPAGGDWLDRADKEAAAAEARLVQVGATYDRADQTALQRARHRYSEGETQFLLGDWLHASILLYGALDDPEFRAGTTAPQALLYLAEALRQQGSCGAALPQFEELVRLGRPELQERSLLGALDCRIRLRRLGGIEPLLDTARARVRDGQPAELAYLIGKASYFRTDLPREERVERSLAAFAGVGTPYRLAATYFQGALQVEAGRLNSAAERFEACLALPANRPAEVEIRELCAMAAGRVYAELGKFAQSLDRYQLVPYDSARFNEALYEVAWAYVRGANYDQAARAAGMIVDLAPESQLAPEATILTGHLNLRLNKYGAASESFNKVINNYAPVRDEIDAILTMHEDPIRYFNELIGKQGKAFEVASVLPPIAVKWASAQSDVGGALNLVMALDAARQELADSFNVIGRVEALLVRGGGLDAMPLARDGWINADAVENGTARTRGQLADRMAELASPQLSASGRAQLDKLRAERRKLQARLEALPRTAEDVEARARRMRARVDKAEKAAFLLNLQLQGARASVGGTEVWINQHRSEIQSDASGRGEFGSELRKQRAVIAGYDEALQALRLEIAAARDAVGGTAQAAGDADLRRQYLALVEQERAMLGPVRLAMSRPDVEELARGEAIGDRLNRIDAGAEQLKGRFELAARRNAMAMGSLIAGERASLQEQQKLLASVSSESRDIIGRIAFRSFSAVRTQFYKLVLKADVGIIDVAWSRKRERVEKIQQISQQKSAELEALDRDFKMVLREVD
jgi:tetratricopeptide (TPR) repeat protein